jgi:heat shock protein HslJ
MNTRSDIVNQIKDLQVCQCDAGGRHVVIAEGLANRFAANARLRVSKAPTPPGILVLELVADHGPADVNTAVSAAQLFDLGGFMTVTVKGVENEISRPVPKPGTSAAGAEAGAVEARRWRATHFLLNKRAPEPVIPGTRLTACLSGEVSGTIHGSGGCNTYGASFVSKPGAPNGINIYDLIHTMEYCDTPEGLMAQERRFFEYLLQATEIEYSGETLELRSEPSGLGTGVQFALDRPE